MEDNLLILAPIEEYQKPNLPTYHDTKPDLSKKVPSRWKNKAMIAAIGLGLFGTIPLSGCEFHLGGAGPAPIYVAHLTEQEALNMIRIQLEEAGLNFDSEVPSYTIQRWGGPRWENHVGINLFDEEKNVAITLINMYDDAISSIDWGEDAGGRWQADRIETEFSEQHKKMIFGVFYNPSSRRVWRNRNDGQPHTEEEFETLTEQLEDQVQNFIHQLREEGIIE